ncbi:MULTISPECIES: Mov34/MPN/PAD-1 family protein [unclassified Roseovarius]|uniref:Mov34/MPN/PAD-1 family protein n=1 Tax=unclassified Roseovarius TaxID=2614913 RepID=UPI00273D090A|nr:Mov34/MPN/PAD-1 family protein [Roseovarius sp. MMSF_3350]
MDIEAWLSGFEVVAVGDLKSPAATALVTFTERHASELMTVVETRRSELGDLVILDFRTGCPQKPFYPIKRTERLAIRFAPQDGMPLIYVLRDDFPDTFHQQLTAESAPRAICIDDRIWAEARLTWTPAELGHRILSWFDRAIRGELHDARQPLDPIMIGSHLSFVISRRILGGAVNADLVAVRKTDQILRVRDLKTVTEPVDSLEPICLVAYRIAAEEMQRLTFAPENLGSLADMLARRGIDLLADLRQKFSDWLGENPPPAWRINSRFVFVVEMPIIAPDGAVQNGTDLRAFITDQSVGDIAVALGIAERATPGEGSQVGFVKRLVQTAPDEEAVRAILAQSAEIHYEFDRELATQLSGRKTPDIRNVVLVGGGTIGSHLAECLSREGRFEWTVIDDDRLLPHNLARHIGRGENVTNKKAALVAAAVSATLDSAEPVGRPISANVLVNDGHREEIDRALNETDLIIDATASVLAGRFLSDHPSEARRVSAFFNPVGSAGILLAEPADRSLTLRDLEAQFFGLVGREATLANLLADSGGSYAYTGACRAITNRMPESNVMALSGLIAGALGRAVDQEDAVMKVWSLSGDGDLESHGYPAVPVVSFAADDWSVVVDAGLVERVRAMRNARLPNETGGVLTGVVDIPAQTIHIVDAAPAPPDSVESPGGFTRGTEGVREDLDGVIERTRGQVRYIGEWHSHPPRAAARPSATDLVQIDWLSTVFDIDTLPALMLIAGDGEIGIILANRYAESLRQGEEPDASREATG